MERGWSSEGLERLVRGIHSLGLKSGVQSEVLVHLLKGRRTITELVRLMFAVEPSCPQFHSYYVRVWRAVRELEARGMVSAPLFGKDKPYRLTRRGVEILLSAYQTRGEAPPRVVGAIDSLIFAATIALGISCYLLPGDIWMPTAFTFLLGVSSCRLATRLWSVW